jgi:hypothetical protein
MILPQRTQPLFHTVPQHPLVPPGTLRLGRKKPYFTNTFLLQTFQAQVHGRSCIAAFIQGGLRGSRHLPLPYPPHTQQHKISPTEISRECCPSNNTLSSSVPSVARQTTESEEILTLPHSGDKVSPLQVYLNQGALTHSKSPNSISPSPGFGFTLQLLPALIYTIQRIQGGARFIVGKACAQN